MVLRDFSRVAEPRIDEVGGFIPHQLRLPARPKVLEEFRPRLNAGTLDRPEDPSVGVALAVELSG
jgi:hypothetical protein